MLTEAQNDALTRGRPGHARGRAPAALLAAGGGRRRTDRGRGVPLGVVEAGRQGAVIELEVINERIGLITPEK